MKLKTYLTIIYTIGNHEHTRSFIRPRNAAKPTDRGAARMIATQVNAFNDNPVSASEISICRIEEAVYQNR